MRFATALATIAVTTAVSIPAFADCVPGTGLCAGAGVGVAGAQVGGQIVIGVPPFFGPPQGPPPAPPPQAAPPPAPPPPAYAPAYPPPQYGWAPPPRHIVAQPDWSASRVGIDLHFDGAAGFGGDKYHNAYGLGGAGLALKYRATRFIGLELGLDVLGGHDWNANKDVEVSGHLGGNLYFNPRSRVQVYMSSGLTVDHAKGTPRQSNFDALYTNDVIANHVGGYAGLGLEAFVTPHLSFHGDLRGFVRAKVSGSPGPEFTDPTTGQASNVSGGLVGQGGATIYF